MNVQARAQPLGAAMAQDVAYDPVGGVVGWQGASLAVASRRWAPPVHGRVYGTLLNFRGALAALGDAVNQPPYGAPPRAPVLYVKPRNTLCGAGTPLVVPDDADELEIGATLGVVFGRTACRVSERDALGCVAGYTIVADACIPHASLYRPAVRFRARDRSCAIGPCVVAAAHVADPDALSIRVYVDGLPRLENTTANLVRPVATLIAAVTDFMTLAPGDVLLAGTPENAPRVRAGQRVAIEIDGLGRLENPVVAQNDPGAGEGR